MEKPLRATKHCRHYSYETSDVGRGSHCAKGVFFRDDKSVDTAPCMPFNSRRKQDADPCEHREEYTAEERATWEKWCEQRMVDLGRAIDALPDDIKCGQGGRVACPVCETGEFCYSRQSNGHVHVGCTTQGCVGAHLNVDRNTKWPR